MKIAHRPLFNTDHIAEHYSTKDGVPITYVCTSAFHNSEACFAGDIFYRSTPHPEFGNRYFALYFKPYSDSLYITSADNIENLSFDMVEVEGELHYSQHRHDMFSVGGCSIDGGRSYLKRSGDLSLPVKTLKVKDGEFVLA